MMAMVCFFMVVCCLEFLLTGNWDEIDVLRRVGDAERCAGAWVAPLQRLARTRADAAHRLDCFRRERRSLRRACCRRRASALPERNRRAADCALPALVKARRTFVVSRAAALRGMRARRRNAAAAARPAPSANQFTRAFGRGRTPAVGVDGCSPRARAQRASSNPPKVWRDAAASALLRDQKNHSWWTKDFFKAASA